MSKDPADQRIVATFRITDYEASKRFYVDGLGFTVDWEHRFQPEFPVFAQLSRDGMIFFISQHRGDCQPGGLIHLYVNDVDAWYEEFLSRGVTVSEPPNEGIPGLYGMGVTDPDTNQIRILQRLAPADRGSER